VGAGRAGHGRLHDVRGHKVVARGGEVDHGADRTFGTVHADAQHERHLVLGAVALHEHLEAHGDAKQAPHVLARRGALEPHAARVGLAE
jgi:hypothetical protein